MRRRSKNFIAAFFMLFAWTSCNVKQENVLKYVQPNIGTAHSRWFFYTPAALPHGMAKLAPSTNGHYGNPSGWEAVGYDARHESIEGFVHFHEWQIGGLSFMPANGPLRVKPGDLDQPGSGYRSHFDRKNEIAEPGYYKVLLDDYNITAELTATERVGFHRYTFSKNDSSRIILDVGHKQGESGEVKDAAVRMVDDTHFEGFVTTYPQYFRADDPEAEISMFFWGETDKKPGRVGAFTDEGIRINTSSAKGKGAGLFLEYKTGAKEVVELKVGLSYTSVENAKANFENEAKELSFEQARAHARLVWSKSLGRLYVQGPDKNDKVKFYTGLFHAMLGRGIASDVNGDFPRYKDTPGRLPLDQNGKPRYRFYNSDAVWGAYWNLTQLWALAYPERYKDYVQTQLQVYKNRGWFGDGIANGQFASGVGTNFVGLVIAAAYNLGIWDSRDTELAYKAVKDNELNWQGRKKGAGKMDLKAFVGGGYVPFSTDETNSSSSNFSASHTLEYSFSSFAAAQMAKGLGKEKDYQELIQNSNNWRLLFNPKSKLIQPKTAGGLFIDKFDPYEPWRGFQEGNAVQYTFFVPQNPAGLIQAIGKDQFNARLDSIFNTAQKGSFGGGKEIDAFAGVKSAYNHGNQPNLQVSWLFNFSGKPWLTQKWTRAICNEFYGTENIHGYGYGQDEDQGQLGSWYVMSALGLFDVKGFTDRRPIIEFGSPVFQKTSVYLENGKELVIETKNNTRQNVYVQSAEFNGKPLGNCWMYRDELMKGGKLVFFMGDQPNMKWGTQIPPPSVQ